MFQDFAARELVAPRHARAVAAADEAVDLICRYPNLSEVELARLINLFGGLSAVDVAMMASDRKLGSKLDCFFAGHRFKIRGPIRHYGALIAVAIGSIFIAAWAVAFAG